MLSNNTNTRNNFNRAFTLIELLIVVSLIGILSGVTLTVINANRQREVASDSVKQANLEKLVQGVESYKASEGIYPVSIKDSGLITYISKWPNGTPAGAVYEYFTDSSLSILGLSVITSDGGSYKYRSEWGEIKKCDSASPKDTVCEISGYKSKTEKK
ncbi:MAG: hypothetical protein ACD_22C00189G0005 [uncultured bacterium]|nr:MAG: hypothetical protein ACD_22C00189G0005 [uncultured bacterium]